MHAATPLADSAARVLAYHQRSKHRLERYAAGPETLDWSAQPDPFREFAGSPRLALPRDAAGIGTSYEELHAAPAPPRPLDLSAIGTLLELSLALSAWKEYGPDRWALRCNPSSGNLHPTEAYLLCRAVPELDDGVHHYCSREHVLERRCRLSWPEAVAAPQLWVALTSVHWREAWKYGERAWRYCQLDIGHALGALRYAAALLGWKLRYVEDCDDAALAQLLGLARHTDFAAAEAEQPDLLLAIEAAPDAADAGVLALAQASEWLGKANLLDPHPMYRWPVIDEVTQATRHDPAPAHTARERATAHASRHVTVRGPIPGQRSAVEVIRGRRSAQRFDREHRMTVAQLLPLLQRLLPDTPLPADLWSLAPGIDLLLFVHRVEGLAPGLYALLRGERLPALRHAMNPAFLWQRPDCAPAELPLYLLHAGDFRQLARTLCCRQAIAGDSCIAWAMLAEFDTTVRAAPWRYRQLHWEAGLIGQTLYLEAEALALRGTGIGCFFDDALHELLGLTGMQFQCLYQFTLGKPLADPRILTLPPYPDRP
jgi:SagB-type dehydrogenase family enzyme